MDMRRIIVLHDSWNEFQVFLMIACVLSGVGGLLFPEQSSSSVQETLPRSLQYVWYTGLLLGGIIGIYGSLRDLFIERIGNTILTGIILGYVILIFSQTERPFSVGFFIILGFLVACILRILRITRMLRRRST